MYVWGMARAFGGVVVLRIEDHDQTRSKSTFERALLEDLEWLGFEPDLPSIQSFRAGQSAYRQSDNDARYANALALLEARNRVYPCACSRRDIAQLVGDEAGKELRYPGTCRDRTDIADTFARRVILDDEPQHFFDLRHGTLVQNPSQQCGDILVRDRHGQWTYQFAVVVDDMVHETDMVIRGDDLLESTGRQLQLAKLLARVQPPLFFHHPLIMNAAGRKLSKANQDTSLRDLRDAGVSAAVLLGKAAAAVGLLEHERALTRDDVSALVYEQLTRNGKADVLPYLTTPVRPSTTSSTHWGPLNPSVRSS